MLKCQQDLNCSLIKNKIMIVTTFPKYGINPPPIEEELKRAEELINIAFLELEKKEVLNFLLFIKSKTQLSSEQDFLSNNPKIPSFLTFIDELNAETSSQLTTKLPKDFAQNLDSYL